MLRDYEKVMKAAADPTRARILMMLQGGEMCVCQVIAVLGLSQSTVSKHLSLLKGAGLVRERRERRFVRYSLETSPSSSSSARVLLGKLDGLLEGDPQVASDRERAQVSRRTVESMAAVWGGPFPGRRKRTGGKR